MTFATLPILSPLELLPELSLETQTAIRIAYGILMMGTLFMALPHWRRFFISERWGGYAKSSRQIDAVQNPIVSPVLAVVWLLAAGFITIGWWSVWAALINLLLCRYFFVQMRWNGVLRGMGAPGFMSYWLGAAVFLLEYTSHHAPDLRSLALLVLQIDFAFIMLSAGIYKLTAGYARNHGMEGGMVNPFWGYWWWLIKGVRPTHWVFKSLNHLAWSLEVVGGILMLFPSTRFLGALIILGSFVFIATQIRLGFLCEMVIACCLLFFHPGSFGDQIIGFLVPEVSPATQFIAPTGLNSILAAFLWGYFVLLPFAHAGLFYNFYAGKSLPGVLQHLLEGYTNFFGIIIWRVFSADHTNFFIRVYSCPRSEQHNERKRKLISRVGLRGTLRHNHVAESIVLTTLFTTLKYYPTNSAMFRERLLRYARTVLCSEDSLLLFEYVSIRKFSDRFGFVSVAEYFVDPVEAIVTERVLDSNFSVHSGLSISPIHEGSRPGSYVPLRG